MTPTFRSRLLGEHSEVLELVPVGIAEYTAAAGTPADHTRLVGLLSEERERTDPWSRSRAGAPWDVLQRDLERHVQSEPERRGPDARTAQAAPGHALQPI